MISEEKMKSENQLDQMQKLMRVFTHDLRNPLLNINALVEETDTLIRDIKQAQSSGQQQELDNILNTELPDILEMLKDSANRMDDMVLGANDISHCMFDELQCETIDMRQMFQRGFALLNLGNEGFELHFGAELPMVNADPLAVRRIVNELLMNAKQAVDAADKPTSRCIQVCSDEEGQKITFYVEDSGCGFEQSEKESLFAPFFSGVRFQGRSGMGLARVRAWVEHHGGDVSLDSADGKTTVSFSLPKA